MILVCEECFHPLDYFPHVCLIRTCPNCFSSKSIFERFCLTCKTSVPCHYCQNPSFQSIGLIKLCFSHLSRICNLHVFQRHVQRTALNNEYNDYCLKRRFLRKAGRVENSFE